MPETINPFAIDAFNMVSMTKAINLLPNNFGKLNQKGMFPTIGVRTRTIIMEEHQGVLTLLQTKPVGSPGQIVNGNKRKARSFVIPHIPYDDSILPEAYQGVREFGSTDMVSSLAKIVNDKLAVMKNNHMITLEHLRIGALKGKILDADGTTLYDLYDEFGQTKKVVIFALNIEDTDVASKCREVLRHIEDNLMGDVMTHVECLCSPEFFDALVSHPSVKEVFLNHSEAVNRLGGDPRGGFKFGGITFEEYRGQAPNANGDVQKFLSAGEARFYPAGTMATFNTLFAPADFNETIGTLGLEFYAHQEPRKHNRGIDIHTQSNPLPICFRPGVLVQGNKS